MVDLLEVSIGIGLGGTLLGLVWRIVGPPLFRPPPPPPPTPATLRAEEALRAVCDPAFFGLSDGDLEVARLSEQIRIQRHGSTVRMIGWHVKHGSRWESVHSVDRLRGILVDHYATCADRT